MKFKLVSDLAGSDIKEDALGLEGITLEEIVKAVEVKESAKEANRTLGKTIGNVNEVTKAEPCHACRKTDHGHTREDRLRNCPYKDKPCPNCKVKGHLPVSGWCRTPQTGKAKEEVPPREGTLSSGGKVGLVSYREESDIFTINARKLSEANMDTDHYNGCWEESDF